MTQHDLRALDGRYRPREQHEQHAAHMAGLLTNRGRKHTYVAASLCVGVLAQTGPLGELYRRTTYRPVATHPAALVRVED